MKRNIVLVMVTIVLAGCGAQEQASGPTAQDAQRWAANWCGITMRSTRADMVIAMGPPTAVSDGVSTWEGLGYQFHAFFDETGTVTQLDVNETAMSDEQRARITVPADTGVSMNEQHANDPITVTLPRRQWLIMLGVGHDAEVPAEAGDAIRAALVAGSAHDREKT